MKSLGRPREEHVSIMAGETKPKTKTVMDYDVITVSEKAFPDLASYPLDHECTVTMKLQIVGRPDYGKNKDNEIKLRCMSMEMEKGVEREMGYKK